jgi:tRNA threonylcarbamoyladenosine biosynthesis protein TsaB
MEGRHRSLCCAPSDLRNIFLTVGPGSFTGIRIGIAFAQGLAFHNRVRLHPVNTLLALAMGWPGGGPVLPILPAGRDLWYAAVYERNRAWKEKVPPAAVNAKALLRLARKAKAVALPDDGGLPVDAHFLQEPLSRILYDHRRQCGPARGPILPIYLKSLYD